LRSPVEPKDGAPFPAPQPIAALALGFELFDVEVAPCRIVGEPEEVATHRLGVALGHGVEHTLGVS
jgi:hypothetical protein